MSDFDEILVISAFKEGEGSDHVKRILDLLPRPDLAGCRFERVGTRDDLIAAINRYAGPLMIFDGHGSHSEAEGARLIVGDERVDVQTLDGAVRMPPIVVLSACDTHAAARSTETVANAMLDMGARTVLGTNLPVRFDQAAFMIARLVQSVRSYLPRAGRELGRVLRWSEFIGGLLRTQFLFEVVTELESLRIFDEAAGTDVLAEATCICRHSGGEAIAYVRDRAIATGRFHADAFTTLLNRAIVRSDFIRYIQLGNPETITVGSAEDLVSKGRELYAGRAPGITPKWRWDEFRPSGTVDLMELMGMRPYGPFEI